MFKNMNIGMKLVTSVAVSILVMIVILAYIISLKIESSIDASVRVTMQEATNRYANFIQGSLNETIALTKAVSRTINSTIKDKGNISVSELEILLKNSFDGSAYADYAFFSLNDKNIISSYNIDSRYLSESGNFGVILVDKDLMNAGGLEVLQFKDSFRQSPIISEIEKSAKNGDLNTVYVGEPNELDFGNGKFLGLNIAMPIFDKNQNYIGVVGFTFNLIVFGDLLQDPSLDLYKGNTRALISDSGIITLHSNPKLILKPYSQGRTHESARIIDEAVKNNKNIILDNYVSSAGIQGFVSISSFATIGNSSRWSILLTAPSKSVFEPLREVQTTIVIVSAVLLVVILFMVYMIINMIVGSRIPLLLNSLETFFRFLNHEKVDPKPLKIRANDEIGKMGTMINGNVEKIKASLIQDQKAIAQSAETAKAIESGDLTA
ncbi:methyl-accepting chemotaxis protein, partial [Helicobacter sp. WB40]|nr:methyl-accepting chemotaxis protein [Helicobacter sp. WB40]MDA3969698.1 methyl-accepting chemotaxis protein [Helicobacter ibis]